MAAPKEVLGLKPKIHRKALKNLLRHNFLIEILEIWYVALSSDLLPNLFKMVLSQSILGLLVKCT